MRDVLSREIIQDIQQHLRAEGNGAQEGWKSGSDDEDVLTGDLGGSMRCSWQITDSDDQRWRWRMTYKKFRGRGKDAEEKIIGADGIFQIEVEDKLTGQTFNKGLLFQAKKVGVSGKKKLHEQVENMEALVPNGSAVFIYGPNHYAGMDASRLTDDANSLKSNSIQLGNYLADYFLPCKVGKRGLYYDANREMLIIPDETNGFIALKKQLHHRLRIEVQKGWE